MHTLPTATPGLMPLHRPARVRPRLDTLTRATTAQLQKLFAAAETPTTATAHELHGDLVTRGFVPFGPRILNRAVARPGFFWTGKSFRDPGDGTLAGHNFFQLAGGMRALPFVATVGESVTDGRPAVRIDYGNPALDNPRPARWFYDEIRRIEPGLWLGPGYLRRNNRTLLTACWFALDRTVEFAGASR